MELDPQSYFEEKTEEMNADDSESDIEIIDEIQNAPKLCDTSTETLETTRSDISSGFISGEDIAQKNVPHKSQAVKEFLEDLEKSK